MGIVARLRDPILFNFDAFDLCDEAADEIERLREVLQKIADGNVDRESAEKWRTDGQYSKNDRCSHGHFMYEECAYCISDFARAARKETE